MKKYSLYFVFIIVVVIAGVYYLSNNKGTLKLRDSSFAIESPNEISRIEFTSKGEVLTLEKESNSWKVNNKYRAKSANVENFNLALSRVMVFSPVSKSEKSQVASILLNDGILVEIFKNRKILKKYYVSRPSMNREKTYMMMDNSKDPFIVRIPAFNGLLAELFIVEENYWRDKTVFDYKPQDIKEIKVQYPLSTEKSFKAINYNDGTFAIQKLDDDEFFQQFDVGKVARYFTYFQRIAFEGLVENINNASVDSILNSDPFCVISVLNVTGDVNKISIFRKPPEVEYDEFGNKLNFDYDRAYATFNNNNELVTIQYYVFDPLFKEIDYFR